MSILEVVEKNAFVYFKNFSAKAQFVFRFKPTIDTLLLYVGLLAIYIQVRFKFSC